ncbi:MAG: glycosyl hydrolase family 18 protein [candidate division FCPU426 bacterium]
MTKTPDNGELQLSAWLFHENPKSLKSFETNAAKLSRVYPVWYNLGDEGLATRRILPKREERARVMATAKAHGVEVWPLVSNFNESSQIWDHGRVARFLNDSRAAKFQITRLIELAKEDGAQGIDLDYEAIRPTDRQALSDFCAMAYEACQKAGIKLGMAVHAKDSEPGNDSGSAGQDYAALASSLDSLQLMVYDYHWSTSAPGAIAPVDWTARVLRHALSLAPADKIEFGFPVYGYDWLGQQGDPIGFDRWQRLVETHGPAKRDPESAELVLKYQGREAWFNDSISVLRKLLQAREAGVSRATFWVLGSEDPRLWEMLEDFPRPFALPSHGV